MGSSSDRQTGFRMRSNYHDLSIGESITTHVGGSRKTGKLLAIDHRSVAVRVGETDAPITLGHFRYRHEAKSPEDIPSVVVIEGARIGADVTRPFMSGTKYSTSLVSLHKDARLFIAPAHSPMSPPGPHVFPAADCEWNFGDNWLKKVRYGWHLDVDVDGELGHPMVAGADGTVLAVRRFYADTKQEDLWWKGIALQADDGFVYIYMHWDELSDGVSVGARVQAGDAVGVMGRSGYHSMHITTHLHFEMLVMRHPERFRFAFEMEPDLLPTPNRVLPADAEGFVVNPYPYLVRWFTHGSAT